MLLGVGSAECGLFVTHFLSHRRVNHFSVDWFKLSRPVPFVFDVGYGAIYYDLPYIICDVRLHDILYLHISKPHTEYTLEIRERKVKSESKTNKEIRRHIVSQET